MDGRTGPNQYAFQTSSKLWRGWGSSECESRIEVMVLRGVSPGFGGRPRIERMVLYKFKNQRTNSPVNAHLISGPTVRTKTIK